MIVKIMCDTYNKEIDKVKRKRFNRNIEIKSWEDSESR